jgi:MFS family permease
MAFQHAIGQMYNLFSVKRVYLTRLTIFEAGSILCALAPTSMALIAGHLITGVGGGGLYIGSVVLVGHAVPEQYRAVYISIITSLGGVASAVGPPLGGGYLPSLI